MKDVYEKSIIRILDFRLFITELDKPCFTHSAGLRQALRIADHVIFMYLGEVIESGPAEEVFNNPKQELTQKYLEGAFS